MVIKLNNKPIQVTEEPLTTPINILPICITVTGYTSILCIVDYICYIFFSTHPFGKLHDMYDLIMHLF